MSVCVRCFKPLTSARSSMCDECRIAAGLPPLVSIRSANAPKPSIVAPTSFLEISDAPLADVARSDPPPEQEPEAPAYLPVGAGSRRAPAPVRPPVVLNAAPPPDSDTAWDSRACMLCGKLHPEAGDYCPECAVKFNRDPMGWHRAKRQLAQENTAVGFRICLVAVGIVLLIGLPALVLDHIQAQKDHERQTQYRSYLERMLESDAASNTESASDSTTASNDPQPVYLTPDSNNDNDSNGSDNSGDQTPYGALSGQSSQPADTPDQTAAQNRYEAAEDDILTTDMDCQNEYDTKVSNDTVLRPVLADVAIARIQQDLQVMTASFSSMSPSDQQMAHLFQGTGIATGTPEGAAQEEIEKWREIRAGTWTPPSSGPDLSKLLSNPWQ